MANNWIHDGGHGGSDGGASANGIIEKIYTLEASLYVDNRLIELGIDSDVTRRTDTSLSSGNRTAKVKKYKKCISHHYNAGGGHGAEFIHSIYSDGVFEGYLVDEFQKAGYPLRPKPIYTRKYPNKPKLDYYFMHRDTGSCRTTIVEYEFVDGKYHNKIKDKHYRQGMYECVVKAICRDEGITYKEPNDPNVKVDEETFYRVVTGSYNDKANAEKRVQELKKAGFESFIAVYKK